MTAHPKIDPRHGQMHFFGYNFAEPYLVYHVADRNGVLVSSQPVAVKASTMIHDFAITDRDVDLLGDAGPLRHAARDQDGEREASTIMPYVWRPEYGSRLGVMPLGGPASAIRWVEIETCYVFHGMNTWREGDDVVLDVCRMAKVFGRTALGPPPRLHRWRIDTAGPAPHDSATSSAPTSTPSCRRSTGATPDRANRHGWRVETDRHTTTSCSRARCTSTRRPAPRPVGIRAPSTRRGSGCSCRRARPRQKAS